jgi:hypothetical protein
MLTPLQLNCTGWNSHERRERKLQQWPPRSLTPNRLDVLRSLRHLSAGSHDGGEPARVTSTDSRPRRFDHGADREVYPTR